MTTLREGTFTLDGRENFKGFTTGETRNGHAMPMFTKAEGLRIAEWQPLDYDHEQDAFYLRLYYEDSDDYEDYGCYAATTTERGALYPIGTEEWEWKEVQREGAVAQ